MIPVTKPFLPPVSEYQSLIQGIWDRQWVTNNGPLVQEFELKCKNHLEVEELLFVSNGTIAIQLAIKALGISKKVITTPFSYVATSSSLVWEGCEPVFVDIDRDTFNIDPVKIEEAIDEDTQAILATHCFGNPCDVLSLEAIAKKHGLKLIFDGAHCFGTKFKNQSIFRYGDLSTVSFHATKLLHTVEGGAVFSNNLDVLQRINYMRNFGHDGPERFNGVGINAKNSEVHAAMGLANLNYVSALLDKRKKQYFRYLSALNKYELQFQKITPEAESNYSYFPVIFENTETMSAVKKQLELMDIYTRRYFHPSLNKLDYTSGAAPIAEDIASRILCLPMYHELQPQEQDQIADVIRIVLS